MDGLVVGWLILIALGGALGALIGRWPAVLLASLLPLVAVAAGEDRDGVAVWLLVLVFWAPPATIGLLLGIAWRKHRSRDTPTATVTPH